jgi:hypothetical protein
VTQTEKLLACAHCARPVREREADDLGWRYWSDGRNLHLICPLCAHREFAPDDRERRSPLARQLAPPTADVAPLGRPVSTRLHGGSSGSKHKKGCNRTPPSLGLKQRQPVLLPGST